MSLREQKGNMYEFVTHTWNVIKGKCDHNCLYCYMKIFKLNARRFDEKELKTNLGKGKFIFVGSSNDMFSKTVPKEWINVILGVCRKYDNKYLFQSKNPERMQSFNFPPDCTLGTTIESNRDHGISKAPCVAERAKWIGLLKDMGYETMITIEPILDFDFNEFVAMIKEANPTWVNVGADSKGHKLPEPGRDKVFMLIEELKRFTEVRKKGNLKRLMRT